MGNFKNLEPLAFSLAMKNARDGIVIDVRTPEEVADGVIEKPLIINYRLSSFTTKINELPKDSTYFVYCQTGSRSRKSCILMENLGFKKVINLEGGWKGWTATFLTANSKEVKPMIRIGDTAPDFEAVSTEGKLQLYDYQKDNWLIMFSHPADFTPVCTTELAAFAKESEFFKTRNTKLLGLSVDSLHAHLAWINNIQEKMKVTVNYPIIADFDMKVAQIYGMMHPNESSTATVRAAFFIDPEKKIRLVLYYPTNVGRSMVEIKRVLVALQTVASENCSLPVDWNEGDKGMENAPETVMEMKERISNSKASEQVDFYLVKKTLK